MSTISDGTTVQAVRDATQVYRFVSGKLEMTGVERDLRSLFEPRGVVVVGASPKPSLAKSILNNIIASGFDGNVAAVNPNYDTVDEVDCYKCISDVPFPVDLALLCVRAENILPVLEECRRRSVGAAQIISSGFAELESEEGRARQQRIQLWADDSTTVVVGPNTIGVINLHRPIIAVWESKLPKIVAGAVSGVFQSGQMVAIMHPLIARGVGISKIATTGNEVSITTAEVIDFLAADPQTEIIVSYSEGIKDPERFALACTHAREQGKPIIMLRVGAHPEVRNAINRHTATQAANSYESDIRLLEEQGVITVNSVEDLIETIVAFKASGKPRGNRVAFASFSGGMGNIMADLILSTPGLKLVSFSNQLRKRLADVLPRFANSFNPLDLSAQSSFDSGVLSGCLQVLGQSGEFDILLWGMDLPTSIDNDSPLGIVLNELVAQHPEIALIPVSQISGVSRSKEVDGNPPAFAGLPILQGTGVSVRALGKAIEWHAST
ncbi:CoA-binding protein [Bradyrhizobium canariense]|uniref:CoA-binding protein n=1 Tax=Bradyrhizobium canariense TaxID=255045 RepID=UPI000A198C96|nr:CoA-binding protein [Bradyrhizobium canariense]OSI32963.1 acyl-CoA synthetase (NDP forming) [Bradyrhizobium canariense]OSI36937.1 acyl-CoA synthetase (NDP forming) [Bradyrhizobium canariense]OSI50356.1 acyl-CoA synthetase (NDP forming) [Bradyrhizobium canariense]OSI55777.1 acyl-CoA synthetase (NDP forming) [Bradyrhizobium canariense]OSI59060.1 acyl-CoA synthetase (NDP forming) [Bradyrhizobium canariense]